MNLKSHPIKQTAMEVRRSIQRLETFKEAFPYDQHVEAGVVENMLSALKLVWHNVPSEMKDGQINA